MLNYAGEILLAITLVLSSFLSYWFVWTLNGLGSVPETAKQHNTRAKGEMGEMGEGNGTKSRRLT
jgi:hypothetical protein